MDSLFLMLKDTTPHLSKGERCVGNYLLNECCGELTLSIGELAEKCTVSRATVVRFCQSVGCRGYKELCAKFNSEVAKGQHDKLKYADIHPGDDIVNIVSSIGNNAVNSIRNTIDILDYGILGKVVELIGKAPRVDFYGVGFSGFIALDAQNKFLRIGKTSVCQTDSQLATLTAMNLRKNDVAVLISYTGETNDIIDLTEKIRTTGAYTVSITKSGDNTLSGITDFSLHTVSDEGFIRSGAMSSRIGQLTMIDIIFTLVVSGDFDRYKPNLDKTSGAIREKKTSKLKY